MLDKSILDKKIADFVESVIKITGLDFIAAHTDGSISLENSDIADCFMAVINQAYVIELLCVSELTDKNGNIIPTRPGVEMYELSIVDRVGEIYNFSDVCTPLSGSPEAVSCVDIYFYGYENSIKVLQELMKLYVTNGV